MKNVWRNWESYKNISFNLLFILASLLILISIFAESSYAAGGTKKEKKEVESFITPEQKMDIELTQAINSLKRSNKHTQQETLFYVFDKYHPEAVKRMVKILRERPDDDIFLQNVIYNLGRLGPKAKRAVHAITPYLSDKNPDFRAVAAGALGRIGPNAREATRLLMRRLFDDDPWVGRTAARALENIGSKEAKASLEEYYAVTREKEKTR